MKSNPNLKKEADQKGFTLIELVASIVIIGILAALAVNKYQAVINNGREAKQLAVINAVESAKVQFVADPSTTTTRIQNFNISTSESVKMNSYLARYMQLNGGSATTTSLLEGTGKTVLEIGKCELSASGTYAAVSATPATIR